jgi:hypothetical protein
MIHSLVSFLFIKLYPGGRAYTGLTKKSTAPGVKYQKSSVAAPVEICLTVPHKHVICTVINIQIYYFYYRVKRRTTVCIIHIILQIKQCKEYKKETFMTCRICSSHFRGGCFMKSHPQCLRYISAEIYYTIHKVVLSDNLGSFLLPLAFETSLIIPPQWFNMSS